MAARIGGLGADTLSSEVHCPRGKGGEAEPWINRFAEPTASFASRELGRKRSSRGSQFCIRLIESLASIGAALYALPRSQSVVGLENNTSFIRAVRAGATLRAVATPITRGRKTQVWDAKVEDGDGRVVATGRVRLLCLDKEEALAGEQVRGPLHPPA